jgi:hypothetical protein
LEALERYNTEREKYLREWNLTDEQAQERGKEYVDMWRNLYKEEVEVIQGLKDMDTKYFM